MTVVPLVSPHFTDTTRSTRPRHARMLEKVAIGSLCAVSLAAAGFAQNAPIEQVRERTTTFTHEGGAERKMIAEDRGEVVEVTARPARALRYRLGASTSLEHQSNAPLLPSGPKDDWVSLTGIETGFNLPLSGTVSFDLSIRSDLVSYFHFDKISYWGPSGIALFDYRPNAIWPRFYAGTQLYRYDFLHNGVELTSAASVLAGLDRSWDFHEGKSHLTAGYQFQRFWAYPRSEDRSTHTLFASVTRQLTHSVFAQGTYLWQYTDFESQARRDSRHIVSLGLIYALNPKTALRLYANYVRNESPNPLADYDNFTTGIGAAFNAQF